MGTTPTTLSFSAKIFHPPDSPFPSGKIKQKRFASKSRIEQRRNLPASFERLSNQYFLPSSSQTRDQPLSSLPQQQVSIPASNLLRLTSLNLIQDVIPLHLSQMHPLSLPPTSSIKISKDFDSRKPTSSTPRNFILEKDYT